MWRAFFLAVGGTLCVLGVESLVLDHAVLASNSALVRKSGDTEPLYDELGFEIGRKPLGSSRIVTPPEWAPWGMLSTGAVILLYSTASKIRDE